MNVYLCTDGSNYIPVSPGVVIVAENEVQAQQMLNTALEESGVAPYIAQKYIIRVLNTEQLATYILPYSD